MDDDPGCSHLAVSDEVSGSIGPAQLPACHREGLARRANRDRPLPHAGQARHPDHLPLIDHVLVPVHTK